jgi:flagella basal body P-ring formation protein FlgA
MLAGILIASQLSVAQAEFQAADPVAEAIATAVRAHVASTARVSLSDVELRWLGLGTAVDCPHDAQVLVDSRPGEDFRGRTDLRVTLIGHGEQCARLRLPARIAIWQEVQIASADAAPGMSVEMVPGRAPRDTIRGETVDPERGIWIALHMLRAGAPVTDRDVVLAPAVRAGDPVQLEVHIGTLHIEAGAHMLNDARIGEQVRVANNATGTVVRGRLVDSHTVRVGGTP